MPEQLISPAILFCAAIVCAIIAWIVEGAGEFTSFILKLIGVAAAITAIVLVLSSCCALLYVL